MCDTIREVPRDWLFHTMENKSWIYLYAMYIHLFQPKNAEHSRVSAILVIILI